MQVGPASVPAKLELYEDLDPAGTEVRPTSELLNSSWSDGILEYWNGAYEIRNNRLDSFRPIIPTFQYSIIPD